MAVVQEELMTTSDVADLLKVTTGTVTKLVRDGRLPVCARINRNVLRFRRQDVLDAMAPDLKESDE